MKGLVFLKDTRNTLLFYNTRETVLVQILLFISKKDICKNQLTQNSSLPVLHIFFLYKSNLQYPEMEKKGENTYIMTPLPLNRRYLVI